MHLSVRGAIKVTGNLGCCIGKNRGIQYKNNTWTRAQYLWQIFLRFFLEILCTEHKILHPPAFEKVKIQCIGCFYNHALKAVIPHNAGRVQISTD